MQSIIFQHIAIVQEANIITKLKKFIIGFAAAIAGITVCMGASYIQAKLSPVIEVKRDRPLTHEQEAQVKELEHEQTEILLANMQIELATKEEKKLAKKKNLSDEELFYMEWYDSMIEDGEKTLSGLPTMEELRAQIDAILYY